MSPLDQDRLRYWGACHACVVGGLAAAERAGVRPTPGIPSASSSHPALPQGPRPPLHPPHPELTSWWGRVSQLGRPMTVGPAAGRRATGYGLALRRRLAAVPVLEPTDEPVARRAPPRHRRRGHRRRRHGRRGQPAARRHGLDVLDLVPADLPVEPLLASPAVVPGYVPRRPAGPGSAPITRSSSPTDVARPGGHDALPPASCPRDAPALQGPQAVRPAAMAHAVAPGLPARRRTTPPSGGCWVESAYAMGSPFILTLRAASVAGLAGGRRRPVGAGRGGRLLAAAADRHGRHAVPAPRPARLPVRLADRGASSA